MAILTAIGADITETQTGNFQFTLSFAISADQVFDRSSFDISNIVVSGSADITRADLEVLYVTDNGVIVSVDVREGISGVLTVDLTGTILVDGVEESFDASPKVIRYDTGGSYYEMRSPTSLDKRVVLSTSAANLKTGGVVVIQFDFYFGVSSFQDSEVQVTSGATKGQLERIDAVGKRWVMLVTMPASGEGTIEIWVLADSLGFEHEEVRVSVAYAENIPLVIEAV